jgi:hypothetical protein
MAPWRCPFRIDALLPFASATSLLLIIAERRPHAWYSSALRNSCQPFLDGPASLSARSGIALENNLGEHTTVSGECAGIEQLCTRVILQEAEANVRFYRIGEPATAYSDPFYSMIPAPA